ncbi:unnamed protein product [Clonostachys rosea f. rosea IK726]|uniref:F-box domain-containing protein n=2 Tax=Bionectria ochroleuca TaxID=29856 RepID=A0A0B7JR29_BIOOC|nr:unnamed protein product [Clonostachys rosea f. rosea IK726]
MDLFFVHPAHFDYPIAQDDFSSPASSEANYDMEIDLTTPDCPAPPEGTEAEEPADATSDLSDPATWEIPWPSSIIPVEIFELITSFLSRAEVRSLRRVNKEFEIKVSAKYFKNVVVPFRPELYGDFDRESSEPRLHPSSALFSTGSRIFESFGPHILRFALSLELDEDDLANPPIKPAQEAVTSFWGIYRWPPQTYTRYSDLQGIEQTADETPKMKDALKCLTKVTNMGLSCDPGLGFLTRPDVCVRRASTRRPVFATRNWRQEHHPGQIVEEEDDQCVTIANLNGPGPQKSQASASDNLSLQRQVLEKMVVDAGYEGPAINEAIGLLLDTENASLPSIDVDERAASNMNALDRSSSDVHEQQVLAMLAIDGSAETLERPDSRRFPLVPAFLSRAQKELLLELEWAHRAMIQSYVITMVDNAAIGCYSQLTTLSIAKIPSCHVHIFYRDSFWDSFPNLSNVSLGVIADWRKITKPTPGCIEDNEVSPVTAVGLVFRLLQDYIGKQPGIESLHFEWICGGEFAPSSYQRNQYILPAPFFKDPKDMASANLDVFQEDKLLSLPHLKHLSLKNCWASPHVLIQTVREMGLASLEKLELESVSLSGQPTRTPQFPLGLHNGQAAAAAHFNQMMMMHNGFVGFAQHAHLLPGPPPGLPQIFNPHHLFNQPFFGGQQPIIGAGQHPIIGAGQHPIIGAGQHPIIGAVQHPIIGAGQHPIIGAGQHPIFGAGQHPINAHAAFMPDMAARPETLVFPELLTWAGFIEHFTPGDSIRRVIEDGVDWEDSRWPPLLQQAADVIPQCDRLFAEERRYTIKCLSFKSCGYVAVDAANLNTRALFPPGAHGVTPLIHSPSTPQRIMQRCKDRELAQILPYIGPQETFNLTHAFGMAMGWERVYSQRTIHDATADGVDFPGTGRFSGMVDTSPVPRPWNEFIPPERNNITVSLPPTSMSDNGHEGGDLEPVLESLEWHTPQTHMDGE